jgi:hypothetical protein
VLFAVATLFIFLVLLHYSTVISKLTDENVELAQRVALLEERVSRLAGGEPSPVAQDGTGQEGVGVRERR